VQLAQTEIERLSAEAAKLNAALERLETDKNAVEGKARVELVVYGAIILLIALLATISSILFVNRRRVIATKREGLGPEARPLSPVVESPRASGGTDSAPAGDTASYSLNLAQSSSSDATAPKSENRSGASDATSSSETDEERVTLPI
jgi:hypothetical protein